MSSKDVQELAEAAMRQGARGIDRMAGIGTGGKWAQNTLRDLMQLLGRPAGSPPMDWLEIPTKRGHTQHIHFFCHTHSSRAFIRRLQMYGYLHSEGQRAQVQNSGMRFRIHYTSSIIQIGTPKIGAGQFH